jgi:hypothetical protein
VSALTMKNERFTTMTPGPNVIKLFSYRNLLMFLIS